MSNSDANKQIIGFSGAIWKKFDSVLDAMEFMRNVPDYDFYGSGGMKINIDKQGKEKNVSEPVLDAQVYKLFLEFFSECIIIR